MKHIVGTLKRILDTAQDDQAIVANPVPAGRRHTTKRRGASDGKAPFKHHPLTANQVASVCDWIARNGSQGRGNAVYALAVLFAAHTGVRASELQGLQVQDVTLSTPPPRWAVSALCAPLSAKAASGSTAHPRVKRHRTA